MIEFDQEIYRTESINCEPECDPDIYDCTPCDYTLPFEDCISQTSTRNNTCQDSVYNVCTNDSSRQFCTEQFNNLERSEKNSNEKLTKLDNKNKFGVLHELNTKVEFDSSQIENTYYKLWFHNSKPCSAIVVYIDTYLGDPIVKVFALILGGRYYYNEYGYRGPEVLSVCPPNSYGSLEIELTFFAPSKGTIWVESFDIPTNPLKSYSGDYNEMINYVFPVNSLYTISKIPQNEYRYFPLEVTQGCHDYFVKYVDVELTYYSSIYCGNQTNRLLGSSGFAYIDKHYHACSSDVFYPNHENDIENNNYDRYYVWLSIYYWNDLPEEISFYFFSSESFPSLFPLRKITEYSNFQSAYTLMGDSYLKCDSYFYCNYYRDYYCEHFAPIPASSLTSLFWPIPAFVLTQQTSIFEDLWTNEELWTPSFFTTSEYRLNNSLHYLFLMSADQDQQNIIYYSESDLESCQLIILRPPKNSKGDPFLQKRSVTFKKRVPNCQYHDFIDFHEKSKELFEKMDSAKGQYSTNYRFELDILMMSYEFQDCLEYHDNILSTKNSVWVNESSTTCLWKKSSNEFNEDPCCNLIIQWNENCYPSNKSIQKTFLTLNETYAESNCESVECVSDLSLPSYHQLRELQQDPINGCPFVLSDSFFRQGFQPISECLREHISFRKKCTKDSDCETLGGICDFTSFQCLVESKQREMNYLQCVWERVDTFIREEVKREKSLGTDPTIEELYEAFSKTDCVGKYEIDAKGRKINYLDSFQSEIDCFSSNIYDYMNYRSVDESCWLPFDLDYHEYCLRRWRIEESSDNLCLSNTFCNWNKNIFECSLDNQTCIERCTKGGSDNNSQSEYFCGICENGEDCIELSITNQKECESKEVCVHGENIYLEGDCESIWGCDRKCFDPKTREFYECKVEEQCLTEGGRCVVDQNGPVEDYSNWDHYLFSPDILVNNFIFYDWYNIYGLKDIRNYFSMGVCIHQEFNPSNNSCDWVNPISNNLQRLTMFGCVSYERNQSYCEEFLNGTWINKIASSKDQCSSLYGKACLQNYDSYIFTTLFYQSDQINFKNETMCQEAGGVWRYTMEWVSGNWVHSVKRKPKWIQRQFSSRNSINKTLDFLLFRESIKKALFSEQGYNLKSQAYCLYKNILFSMSQNLCDCTYSKTDQLKTSEQPCFVKSDTSLLMGITPICVGLENKAHFQIRSILFPENSISFESGCIDVELFSHDSKVFEESISDPKISASILSIRKEFQSYSYGFKNQHSTFVGQVVGLGTELKTQGTLNFNNLTLCTTIPKPVIYDSKFKVADFGELIDLNRVQIKPLELKVQVKLKSTNQLIESEHIREHLNEDLEFCCQFPKYKVSVPYYPIMRIEKWEEEDYQNLDYGNQIFAIILGVIYLILSICSLVVFGSYFHGASIKQIPSMKIRSILLIIGVFGFMRSLYFFLLSDGALSDSNHLVHYLFVDFVTLLLFTTFLSYLVLVWIPMITYLFKSGGFRIKSITFIRILIGVNVLVYSFFIALIISYEVVGEKNDVYWCGINIGKESDKTQEDILTTIYRVFWGLYSLFVSMSFFYVAKKLYTSISAISNTISKEKEENAKKRLLVMMGVFTISFFIQFVAFISLEFISQEIESLGVILIYLIIVEIIPCCFVIYMMKPFTKNNKGSSSSSTISSRNIRDKKTSNNSSFNSNEFLE